MRRTYDNKTQSNTRDYLKELHESTLISLRSDVKNLGARFRHTVANPSYWFNLSPLLSLSLVLAACGFTYSAIATTSVMSRRHQKRLTKINLLAPIIRYMLGLTMSSALPHIFKKIAI